MDSTTINDAAKLTRLLHYCKSDARKVIQACSMMESTQEYSILKPCSRSDLGISIKVADAWIKKVTRCDIVFAHNGVALREMTDELPVCYENFKL